jgi:methanogenic corrinoid protein MtbC1
LSQFFKRYGWQVISSNQFTTHDICTAVRSEWVDILGLSMSEDRQIPAMTQLISQARRTSSNPHLEVMVGGPLLRFQPDLAALVGANFSSAHADGAQKLASERVTQIRASQGMTGLGVQT